MKLSGLARCRGSRWQFKCIQSEAKKYRIYFKLVIPISFRASLHLWSSTDEPELEGALSNFVNHCRDRRIHLLFSHFFYQHADAFSNT